MVFGHGPANRNEAAVEVLEIESVWQLIHQRSQQTALFVQSQIGLATLRDVPGYSDDSRDLRIVVTVYP